MDTKKTMRMHTLVVWQNGQFRHDLPLESISDVIVKPDNMLWLDMSDPTEDDATLLLEEFSFHPLAVEDALRSRERSKVDAYDSYYFLVFYAAYYDDGHEGIKLQALSLFIGSNYLVTVHQGSIRQVQETLSRWQSPQSPLRNKVGALVHALLDTVVDDYFPVMDRVADRIEAVEDGIFEAFDHVSIEAIFRLRKDLLRFRHAITPGRDVINVLLRSNLPIFKPRDLVYLQDVYDHIMRVTDNVDTYRDMLSTALDSYLSVQSNNLNQTVKVLTLASIILMTNALVAGIYGMNFQVMPELSWNYGYPLALGLMVVISIVLFVYFRYKKLL